MLTIPFQGFKMGLQVKIGGLKMLRDDAHFSKDSHGIRITVPPWYNVKVKMLLHPCACHHAEIEPYVESIISVSKKIGKPVATVLYPIGLTKFEPITSEAEAALYKAGLPVFPLVSQAAKAIAKYIDYHQQ